MARVLCLGLVAADFVLGLDELPRRAEKYRARRARVDIGGAARMAGAVAALGGEAVLAGRIGDDDLGHMIRARLAARGIDCAALRVVPGAATPFSSILVDDAGERQVVNHREAGLHVGVDGLVAHLAGFDAMLCDTRWPAGAAVALTRAAHDDVPGILDGEAPLAVAGQALLRASHVAFSLQGLRDFTGVEDVAEGLPLADARFAGLVAVTEGADGVRWREGGENRHQPAFPLEIADTLGAGDVWHGAFALALAERRPTAAAMRFANAAGALACARTQAPEGLPARRAVEDLLAGARMTTEG